MFLIIIVLAIVWLKIIAFICFDEQIKYFSDASIGSIFTFKILREFS